MKKIILLCILLMFSTVTFGEVFVSDDFESGDFNGGIWPVGGGWAPDNSNPYGSTSVTNTNPRTGIYSAEFTYLSTTSCGDSSAERPFYFGVGTEVTEIYVEYYIFFPTNYIHMTDVPCGSATNNKFFDIWGNDYGDHPFLIQTWYEAGTDLLEEWVFAAEGGTTLTCDSSVGNVIGDRFYPTSTMLNTWSKINIHLKIDSGVGDGEMELSINDVLQVSIRNMSWSGAPCFPGFFQNGYFMGWSNTGYEETTIINIDDVRFSTTPFNIATPAVIDTGSLKGSRLNGKFK